MKITTTGIVIASASAVVVGAAIFFGLTKTGKGLIKKWFGKKEEEKESATSPTAWKKTPDESTATQGGETAVTPSGRNTATRQDESTATQGGETTTATRPVAPEGRTTATRPVAPEGRTTATRLVESTATQGRGADGGWY